MTEIISEIFPKIVNNTKLSKKIYRLDNSNYKFKTNNYLFLGVDEKNVFDGLNYIPFETIIDHLNNNIKYIVLTDHERNTIYWKLGITNKTILSLESLFPFLKTIKYISNSKKNYLTLLKYKKIWFDKFKDNYTKTITSKYFLKTARKIINNSSLDKYFNYANNTPINQSLVFLERRPNRSIIALDFNSMYASCMLDLYLEPSSLEHIVFTDYVNIDLSTLEFGIYQVKINGPYTEFLKRFNYFSKNTSLGYFDYILKDTDSVITILSSMEINFWSNHCGSIKIKSGFYSKHLIKHPLAKDANRLFSTRQHYKNQGNIDFEYQCKFELALLHSVINKNKSILISNKNYDSLINCVKEKMQKFKVLDELNINFRHFIQNNNKITITKEDELFKAHVPIYDGRKQISSMFSFTISHVRLKLIKLLQYIYSLKYPTICYYNVDSVHVSLNKNDLNKFINSIDNILGTDLGQLKIECIADTGVWFQPGRYFLLKDNKIIKSANSGISMPFDKTPLRSSRPVIKIRKFKNYKYQYLSKVYASHSLSYKSKLNNISNDYLVYNRFNYDEVSSDNIVINTVWNEISNSSQIKDQVYNKLKLISN